MAEYAHARGALLEAELGQVPYSDLGETDILYTSPEEAAGMSSETEADWLAVSVGNVHRLADRTAPIDFFSVASDTESLPASAGDSWIQRHLQC